MFAYVILLFVFSACVDVNMAKRQKRNSCVYNQHTNGCSTPTGHEPYRKRFTPACNEHDVCYFCGQRYGITRRSCDNEFRRKMYELCKDKKQKRVFWSAVGNFLTGDVCEGAADVYYLAVDVAGADHFENPSPSWCEDTCVTDHMGKYFKIVA